MDNVSMFVYYENDEDRMQMCVKGYTMFGRHRDMAVK